MNKTFQIIREYQQLNFSELLGQLLAEKGIEISTLSMMLNERKYYLSKESLYRYFNPSPKSNRFPPEDFIEIFAVVLQLTEEEANILILFWKHCKLLKKCKCSHD
ncbi:hypothetical protein [Nostoc sp. TCL26-01]|uniref:hypothetical protein n=1 Tax=Nostoc sp. TCL26-01 TaxID=2576904 RepID=UPI0015C01A92|nr:hypothetical protein [Nostoc sp. TCL26-01]QLE59826.1 hypothetical protein FD725_30810 [Nostoc sp. TCL26-01]